jgi:2-C-methyl-D-erythritol 2,4-cyclodiphosphate synthase
MQHKRFRIGTGFDFHPFQVGRKMILGGIEIPLSFGLMGHSDADALIHSICDALLGALGETDIGTAFPDTDDRYKDLSSLLLLKEVAEKVREAGFQVENIDTVVIAEVPRIKPFVAAMKRSIAEVLGMMVEDIGIKATTMEKMGTIGRKEGLAVQAVALISSIQGEAKNS